MGHVTLIILDFLFQRSALNFKYVLLKIMDDIYGISPYLWSYVLSSCINFLSLG